MYIKQHFSKKASSLSLSLSLSSRIISKLQNKSASLWRLFVSKKKLSSAFTIVELLIVIVIIAILAAITIISYNGITNRAKVSSLKTELSQSAKKIQTVKAMSGTDTFPATLSAGGITAPDNITYTYTSSTSSFCLTGKYEKNTYYVSSEDNSPQEGSCPVAIQTITSAACSATRTVVTDARDNRSYWIQKLADGKCWMLTNLAYAGGGNNTYGDVKSLSNGTSDIANTFTEAKYYIPAGANPTSSPIQPSTSTDGTGQYGYLYNFCAANGGQSGNGACDASSSVGVTTSISICPANWRLASTSGGEFDALLTAIGATNNSAGSTTLRQLWLTQYAGYWTNGTIGDGNNRGLYWSYSQVNNTVARALDVYASSVTPATGVNEGYALAIRCIAQ